LRTLTSLKLTALLLLLCSPVFAGVNNITEEDGSPSTFPWKIKFPNGTVTDNGDGTASIAGGTGDITAVGDVASGAAFNGTQGTTLTFNNAGGDATLDYDGTDFTFSVDATVPDEAYGVGWNGSLEVPTKNALYDKIETISGASPGTPTNSVQFNDASTFGGDTSLIWDKVLNRLSISRDAGQGGQAIRISSDTGAILASVSHDGSAMFQTLQLQAAPLSLAEGGLGIRSGTSGAIPYFSGTGTVASSLLFAANAVVIGGGAGTAPLTITADTGVTHFLAATATSPAFRQPLTSDILGVRAVTGGGTGTSATGNANALTYYATANAMGTLTADTTAGHTLFSSTTLPQFRQALTGDSIGTMPVARGGTGITTGNSGGVPYFANAGLMASSAALTANAVVIGGGAGTTPATITADTVVTHALMATAGAPAFRQILTTDVVGTYPATAATPGGATTQFQYNNASVFAGTAGITTDGIRFAQGPGTSVSVSMDVAGNFRTVPFTLTSASAISIDLTRSNFFIVTLTSSATMSNPQNLSKLVGQGFTVMVSQDATGSRKLGFQNAFHFGTDCPSYDASTTANTKDYIRFRVSNAQSVDIVGVSKGFR